MRGIDESRQSIFRIEKIERKQPSSFEIPVEPKEKKSCQSKTNSSAAQGPFFTTKIETPPSKIQSNIPESGESHLPSKLGLNCDVDVNMSDLTEDTKSEKSSAITMSSHDGKENFSTCESSRRESGASLSQDFTVPEFFNDREPRIFNFNMRKTLDFENKEFYLIDYSTCFPKLYNSNIGNEEFNEDVYLRFD